VGLIAYNALHLLRSSANTDGISAEELT